MFLDIPHEAYAFYGQRLKAKKLEEHLFKEEHFFEPYYTSAMVHYELYKFLRNRKDTQKSYVVARFHILMILKYFILGDETLKIENEMIKKACEKIRKIVVKKRHFAQYVNKSIEVIEQTKNIPKFQNNEGNELFKVGYFVEAIKKKALETNVDEG